jgi:hypothetical protein
MVFPKKSCNFIKDEAVHYVWMKVFLFKERQKSTHQNLQHRKKTPMKSWFDGCSLCWTVVFLIIGAPTYFCGCDPNLQPACGRYNIVRDAVVVNHTVVHERCAMDCRSCYGRLFTDCYDSYAVLQHENVEGFVTCNIQVDDSNLVRSNAEEDAKEEYPLGSRHTILENKGSMHCSTMKEGRDLAIVGVTFLVLAGVVLSTWMCVTMRQLVLGSRTTQVSKSAAASRVVQMSATVPQKSFNLFAV